MKKTIISLALGIAAASAFAQVKVSNPWVRGTVAQQTATGAFMQLTADQPARLVAAQSPAAAQVEIHEMRMDGHVMRMRPMDSLPLPAGQAVELKPGGYHLMLTGLHQPLRAGDEIPVVLVFETAGNARQTLELKLPVRSISGAGHHGGMR